MVPVVLPGVVVHVDTVAVVRLALREEAGHAAHEVDVLLTFERLRGADAYRHLHLALPVPVGRSAVAAGWAEAHIGVAAGLVAATVVLLYAPRDDRELTVVLSLLQQSFRFATRATVSPLR